MVIEYYSNENQRAKIIEKIESEGLCMFHDDFVDKHGKPTDGKSGQLTFDQQLPPIDDD